MNELAKARAERESDCRLWAPRDALEDLLRDLAKLDARKDVPDVTQLVVWYFEPQPDGRRKLRYVAAGVTRSEHIAMLELAKSQCIEDWRGD